MINSRAERYLEDSGEPSDESLVEAVRGGDDAAYGLLWERHADAARRAARAITTTWDSDDIVSEAFAAVLSAIRTGGGPTEAFRPYLFATIRNVTAMWGRQDRPLPVETLPEHVLVDDAGDPFESISERSVIAQVFTSLPSRHRTVLWYLEVEGMKPREIAPLMGLTANAVSAISYRAREGFRRAWLAAHIAAPGRTAECRWFCERVVLPARRKLEPADASRFTEHLRACRACQVIAADVVNVSQRLRAVALPLILGGAAALAYLEGGSELAAAAVPAGRGEGVSPDAVSPTAQGGFVPRFRVRGRHASRISARGRSPVRTVALTTGVAAIAGALAVSATLTLALAPELDRPVAGAVPPASPTGPAGWPPAAAPNVAETPADAEGPADPVRPPDPSVPTDPADLEDPASPAPPDADDEGAGSETSTGASGSPAPRPDPTGAPSAPPTGPAPTPTPSPDAEPGGWPRFAFTNAVPSGAAVPDLLTGVGTPGARVALFDETGATLEVTTVASDGTFSADVSGTDLHQGMSIHGVHDVAGGGAPQTTLPLGPLTFAEPSISPLDGEDAGDEEPAVAGADAAPAGLRITGIAGAWVAVSTGEDAAVVHLAGGAYEGVPVDLCRGSNRITLQYVDPLTGRGGVLVEHHVVLPAGEAAGGVGEVGGEQSDRSQLAESSETPATVLGREPGEPH